MIQLVDFIWSWARDIYRYQVRKCLADDRKYSPAPTIPVQSRGASVVSTIDAQPALFPATSSRPAHSPASDRMQTTQPQVDGINFTRRASEYQDATFHIFLKWANHGRKTGCIRHANIVNFSFRTFEIPSTKDGCQHLCGDILSTIPGRVKQLLEENRYSINMKRNDIETVRKLWVGPTTSATSLQMSNGPNEDVKALFLFRSFCEPTSWQITREICCVVWSESAAYHCSKMMRIENIPPFGESHFHEQQLSVLAQGLHQMHQLFGRESAACALQNTSRVFAVPSVSGIDTGMADGSTMWLQEQNANQYFALFDTSKADSNRLQHFHQRVEKLHHIVPPTEPLSNGSIVRLRDKVGATGGILALKGRRWSRKSSDICLFVVIDKYDASEAELGRLLDGTDKANDWWHPSDSIDLDQYALSGWKSWFF
jgi:hypothetical protein